MISQRTQQRFRELAESIEAWGDGRWLVMSHDNPDPDALVSMAILGQILKRRFRRNNLDFDRFQILGALAYGADSLGAQLLDLVFQFGDRDSRSVQRDLRCGFAA